MANQRATCEDARDVRRQEPMRAPGGKDARDVRQQEPMRVPGGEDARDVRHNSQSQATRQDGERKLAGNAQYKVNLSPILTHRKVTLWKYLSSLEGVGSRVVQCCEDDHYAAKEAE